ncbi:MAG: hypothetical protein NZ853_02135 [Leptospiraceae bacterium]|nr:hypothetical protein [Leptospiraceae bacterium]MDW7975975.1 hypothetical protein [Leptospiraceae bacterium]
MLGFSQHSLWHLWILYENINITDADMLIAVDKVDNRHAASIGR